MSLPLKLNSVVIIGAGNVAHHLAISMQKAGVDIVQIISRTETKGQELAKQVNASCTSTIAAIYPDADLYLLAVPDDEITEITRQLANLRGIVAHTSGTVAMDVINNANSGVFYPLQSLNKKREVAMDQVPICVEGNSGAILSGLSDLARRITRSVHTVNSMDRKKLHLAAVIVNNFSNHLFHLSFDYLKRNDLDPAILGSLLQETALRAITADPGTMQTGPAIRGDLSTIQAHLAMLEGDENLKKIYTLFSDSIAGNPNETKL